ncbi:MAG: hypothetical protein CVV49_18065, partial [Spirochaetae bacterium HGW-Spirochaetae-5]
MYDAVGEKSGFLQILVYYGGKMINENDQKILISYINHILIEKNRKNFLETVNIIFMNKFRLFLLVCFLLFMVSVIPHRSGFAEENLLLHSNAAEKHILILNSHQQGLPIPDGVIGGVLRSLKMNQVSVDNIYIEHLDFFRFNTPGHRADMARLLEKKYKNIRIDLIITVTKPALDFIDNEGKGLSPYTPVLATIIPVEKRGGIEKKFKRKVAILPWRMDSAGTLRYALELFPETRRVVVVNGIHDEFLPFLPSAREDFAAWEGKIDFEYTMDLTYNEMIKRIGSLPPDCIVIYAPYFADKTGKSFIPVEVAVMVGKSANVPVFSLIDIYINSGIIGGSVLQSGIIGEQAGKFALDLINKRIALTEQITLVKPVYVPMFDWIQLNRSGGNISVLPPESVFLKRPLTLWGQYKVIVLASTAVFIIMIIFSSALVSRNRRLKAAEQSIRESEEKFKSMANTTPLAIYMSSGIEQKAEYINPTFTKLFGYTIEDVPFVSNWWPLAYPDEEYRKTISEEWQRKVENAIINRSEIEPMEAVVTCKDGSRKNILWGFVSTGIQNWAFGLDLTERKQAEAKINDLLAAKELLLQEVHHRIKNNMNTIKGLLTLQLTAEENPSAAASLR